MKRWVLIPVFLLLAFFASGAELIEYIDPDATGAGNGNSWTDAYTSLNAFEAAEQQDLTDGGGDWMHAYARASSGTADTTETEINGWVTGVANYLLIEAASTDRASASGYDVSKYRLEVTDPASAPLLINDEFIRLKHLQLKAIYVAQGFRYVLRVQAVAASNQHYVESCYLDSDTAGQSYTGYYNDDVDLNVKIFNTIITNMSNRGVRLDGSTIEMYNSVIYGITGTGIRGDGASNWTIKNTAVFLTNDDFLDNTSGSWTLDYNSSDDNDGTNNIAGNEADANWTTDFNGAATGDFTLLVGSPLFITGGVDNPGAGLYSTDIEGTSYISTWPIGVYQPVVGGTSAARIGVFGNALVGPFGGAISAMLFLLNIFLTIKLIQAYRKAAFWKGEALFYTDVDNLDGMSELEKYLRGDL